MICNTRNLLNVNLSNLILFKQKYIMKKAPLGFFCILEFEIVDNLFLFYVQKNSSMQLKNIVGSKRANGILFEDFSSIERQSL